jgi:hypothetical protein
VYDRTTSHLNHHGLLDVSHNVIELTQALLDQGGIDAHDPY